MQVRYAPHSPPGAFEPQRFLVFTLPEYNMVSLGVTAQVPEQLRLEY